MTTKISLNFMPACGGQALLVLMSKPPSSTVVMDVGYAMKSVYLEKQWQR